MRIYPDWTAEHIASINMHVKRQKLFHRNKRAANGFIGRAWLSTRTGVERTQRVNTKGILPKLPNSCRNSDLGLIYTVNGMTAHLRWPLFHARHLAVFTFCGHFTSCLITAHFTASFTFIRAVLATYIELSRQPKQQQPANHWHTFNVTSFCLFLSHTNRVLCEINASIIITAEWAAGCCCAWLPAVMLHQGETFPANNFGFSFHFISATH